MKTNKALITNGEKVELSPQQQAPSTARPEDFEIVSGDDFTASVSGQRENDKIAEAKSNEVFNRGSNYQQITNLNEVGERLGEE